MIKFLNVHFSIFLSGLAVGPRTQLFYSWPSRLLTNRPPRRKNVAMARWQHWTREIRGKFTMRFWEIARSVRIIDFQGSCDGRVVKALDLKSNGSFPRRFESCSQRNFEPWIFPSKIRESRFPLEARARLAQSVEHQTFNLRVKGSSPLLGASFFFFASKDKVRTSVLWIFFLFGHQHRLLSFGYHGSSVAQWKRAGPITQRSMDRNHPLLHFFFSSLFFCSRIFAHILSLIAMFPW